MIVWLVEVIKNLHPCRVLNSIYLSYAFYCEVDPYYHCQYSTGNYFQYTHCLWQLITLYVVEFLDHLHLGLFLTSLFYFQEIFIAPICLPCPFEKSFDKSSWFISSVCFGIHSFSLRYIVPLWKVRVWFICSNLALLGSLLSHSFLHILLDWMR